MIPLCPAGRVMTDLSRGKLTQFHNVMDNVSDAPRPQFFFGFLQEIKNFYFLPYVAQFSNQSVLSVAHTTTAHIHF